MDAARTDRPHRLGPLRLEGLAVTWTDVLPKGSEEAVRTLEDLPGPPRLPLIGNAHQVRRPTSAHRTLEDGASATARSSASTWTRTATCASVTWTRSTRFCATAPTASVASARCSSTPKKTWGLSASSTPRARTGATSAGWSSPPQPQPPSALLPGRRDQHRAALPEARGSRGSGRLLRHRRALRLVHRPGGRRQILAQVEVDGIPGSPQVVASFRATSPRPGRPARVQARRRGKALRVSWRGAANATAYGLRVDQGNGAQRALRLPARRHRARVRGVSPARVGRSRCARSDPSATGVSPAGRASRRPPPPPRTIACSRSPSWVVSRSAPRAGVRVSRWSSTRCGCGACAR